MGRSRAPECPGVGRGKAVGDRCRNIGSAVTLSEFVELSKDPIQILGFVGQAVFFSRFMLQWVASEKRKESVIPIGFWWCSIVGGTLTLIYGILIKAPPIILGQLFGNVVYIRNLTFVYRARRLGEGAEPPVD